MVQYSQYQRYMLDTLYKQMPFAKLGELIASLIYVKVVLMQTNIFIGNWFYAEIVIILFQLYIAFSWNYNRWMLPVNYRFLHVCSLASTGINMTFLSLFFVYGDPLLLAAVGMVYVALIAGGNLFFAYIRNIQQINIFIMMSSFSIVTYQFGGHYRDLAVLILIFMTTFIYASSMIHEYISKTCLMAITRSKQLIRMTRIRELLHQNFATLTKEFSHRRELEKELIHKNDDLLNMDKEFYRESDALKRHVSHLKSILPTGIVKTNAHGQIVWKNDLADTLLHFNHQLIPDMDDKQQDNQLFLSYYPFVQSEVQGKRTFIINTRQNKRLSVRLMISYQQNQCFNYWFFEDISLKEKTSQLIDHYNHYDLLTELPNRKVFDDMLPAACDQALKKEQILAVVYVDIDDFHLLNDHLGYQKANQMINLMAKRLRELKPAPDFISRPGGDEFIVVFGQLDYREDLKPRLLQLQSALNEPFLLNDEYIHLTVSMGHCLYPCDTRQIEHLLTYADVAMFHAKAQGKNHIVSFKPEYATSIDHTQTQMQKLKKAIKDNEFYLNFQPIYRLDNQKISHVEVLLRWSAGVSPAEFIPLAEQFDMIQEIGLMVLKNSCMKRVELAPFLDDDVKFCINLSARQIQSHEDIQRLLRCIKTSGAKPKWIEFELTESLLIDYKTASSFIEIARTEGISVAIDDFGSGFSSLSYLKSMSFDVLKIDRQFILDINQTRNQNMLRAMLDLADILNCKVTVEGIETEEQLAFCKDNGCHFAQGYFLARPMGANDLSDMLCQNDDKNQSVVYLNSIRKK